MSCTTFIQRMMFRFSLTVAAVFVLLQQGGEQRTILLSSAFSLGVRKVHYSNKGSTTSVSTKSSSRSSVSPWSSSSGMKIVQLKETIDGGIDEVPPPSPVVSSSSTTSSSSSSSNTASTPSYHGSGPPPPACTIKVIGVGGGGGNAVNRMIHADMYDSGVTFWTVNTDAQALTASLAMPNVLNIGKKVTRGLGAGGDPAMGENAALENIEEINEICEGTDMVIVTAGMGGGTGSGAAPIIARIAKHDFGCLTVGIVSKPFAFEGRKRMKQAEEAIIKLRNNVDTLVVVSNEKLLQVIPTNTPLQDAFRIADDVLRQGISGITDIILKTGLVNVDFADIRSVMKDAGTALMGVGIGTGKNRSSDAALAAISSPLVDFPIRGAKRIVFNIVGGDDMGLHEINIASEVIRENVDNEANIIFGALIDPNMKDEIAITVLACEFDEDDLQNNKKTSAEKKRNTKPAAQSSSSSSAVAGAGATGTDPVNMFLNNKSPPAKSQKTSTQPPPPPATSSASAASNTKNSLFTTSSEAGGKVPVGAGAGAGSSPNSVLRLFKKKPFATADEQQPRA